MAELALAMIALTITAIEDYKKTKRCIKLLTKSSKQIRIHKLDFEVQRAKFESTLQVLLAQCVGDDEACTMMADPEHNGWKDPQVASSLMEQLTDWRKAFEGLMELITDALVKVRSSLERFECGNNAIKNGMLLMSDHSSIENSLNKLRNRTDDLTALVGSRTKKLPRTERHNSSWECRKQVARLQNIQRTSLDLYEAFRRACTIHTGHQSHLSLQPVCENPTRIKFTMAFSQLSITHETATTWLTVESRLTGIIESAAFTDDEPRQQVPEPLKRARDETAKDIQPRRCQKKLLKSVKWAQPHNVGAVQTIPPSLAQPLINLCFNSNFCNLLHKRASSAMPSTGAIGYLELPRCLKHLIYINAKSQMVRQMASLPFQSLYHLLKTSNAQTQISNLSPLLKYRIASQLASAVLQFHATPWLHKSWNSSEVLVADPSEAFVSARIQGPNGSLALAPTIPSPMLIRNALLFRLGIMLLELAYNRPLDELITDQDRDTPDPVNIEFITADRLSQLVSGQMGPRYAEIVKRCINCDFGFGPSLDRPQLQERFYQDVICELKELEEKTKDM